MFKCNLTLSGDILAKINKSAPPDEDDDNVFFYSGKVDGIGHFCVCVVSRIKKGKENCSIGLSCKQGRLGRLHKDMPRLSTLKDILCAIEEPIEFQCSAVFMFSRISKVKQILRLPMTLFDSNELPFNDISGLRLVKREGRKSIYNVILEILPNGSISQSVQYQYNSTFNESIIHEVVMKGVDISNKFLKME